MNDAERVMWVEEIRKLKARYFRLQDNKIWAEYGELFLDDSLFDVTEAFTDPQTDATDLPNVQREPIIGRDAIVAYVSSGLNSRVQSFHEGFMAEIDIISSAAARAIWPMEDRVWFDDGPIRMMHGFGYYHETYTRRSDRWYIQSLKITRIKLDLIPR